MARLSLQERLIRLHVARTTAEANTVLVVVSLGIILLSSFITMSALSKKPDPLPSSLPLTAPHLPTSKRGFSLVELMVVIAIISLLSSVVVANVAAARTKAIDAQRASSLETVELGIQMYLEEYGKYPSMPNMIPGPANGMKYAAFGGCDYFGLQYPDITPLVQPFVGNGAKDPVAKGYSCLIYQLKSDGSDYRILSHFNSPDLNGPTDCSPDDGYFDFSCRGSY